MKKVLTKLVMLSVLVSCSTKKDIFLLQDSKKEDLIEVTFQDYILQPDDVLQIEIKSESKEILFGGINSNETVISNNTLESRIYDGFIIDKNNSIDYPSIGRIETKGLTIFILKQKIEELLIKKGLLINPTVDIKLLNSHFTIIGEVNKPGRYTFLSDKFDIIQAIGMAGDFTINGLRDDVRIIRKKNNQLTINSLDLTSIESITSNNFQIFSGDIIIINPNSSRIKNAGIIGNSGTLLSLLSFILSSIIVISNN